MFLLAFASRSKERIELNCFEDVSRCTIADSRRGGRLKEKFVKRKFCFFLLTFFLVSGF